MPFKNKKILLIIAHPDDEWFLAEKLTEAKSVYILVLSTSRSNFQKRKSETINFLNRKKFKNISVKFLGDKKNFADGECLNHIDELSSEIKNSIKEQLPDLIVCHDYENGHPDHDAAFIATLIASNESAIELFGFCSYRRGAIGLPTFFKPLNSKSDFFILKFSFKELIKMFSNTVFYKSEFKTMFVLGTVGVFFIFYRGGISLRHAFQDKDILSIPDNNSWPFTRYKTSRETYKAALNLIKLNCR